MRNKHREGHTKILDAFIVKLYHLLAHRANSTVCYGHSKMYCLCLLLKSLLGFSSAAGSSILSVGVGGSTFWMITLYQLLDTGMVFPKCWPLKSPIGILVV